jgi:predicted DNA-binding transcriptional regulator AlpA
MPRIRGTVVNASRFCRRRCKDDYRNEMRRRRKRNPLAVGAVAAGQGHQEDDAHPSTARRFVRVRHRRHVLLLTADEIATGIARATIAAAQFARFDPGTQLTVRQVLETLQTCRANLYRLIAAGQFPRATIVYGPRRGERVACWNAAEVLAWLHEHRPGAAPIAVRRT